MRIIFSLSQWWHFEQDAIKKNEFKFKFEFDQKTSELRVIGLLEGN